MNINKVISLAKGSDEKRRGFYFRIPETLKSDFEKFCKKNNVKVTPMLLALMRTALDEDFKGSKNNEKY